MANYKTILVAVDFSEVSAHALGTAVDLAAQLGARLKIVHAVRMHATSLPLEGGAVYIEELHAKEVEDAEKNLARFIAENTDAGTAPESSVRSGEPATEINRAAVDSGADLIVVGTHGRTGLSHLLMGSVAENVLREAPVPVLCVRG